MTTALPHYYCITHAEPAWPLPEFLTVIGTGDYVPARGLALSQLCPEQAMRNRYLGEYVALFQIRKLLVESRAEGFVGVCHYRRFALPQPPGILLGFNHHAPPDVLAGLTAADFVGDGQTPIVPSKVQFPVGPLQQIVYPGGTRDLLMFFGDAIDCGVITPEEAAAFIGGNSFIAAPTVAYLPVAWFVDIVYQLELVASRFYRYHYIEREGYPARSMAFCCERLQALLLLRHINAWGSAKVIWCPLTLLNNAAPGAQP